MRILPLLAIASVALACGPGPSASRAVVPGLDPLSGALSSVEVELPGCDFASVKGPAAQVLVGGALENGRVSGGGAPDCLLRRTASGAFIATSARCSSFLGAYASLEHARQFLLSAGAEALSPALVLADPSLRNEEAPAGVRYVPGADCFTLLAGPAGARVPAALNPGAAVRELARRQLRSLLETRPAEAEGVALFLGAAASGDPAYLASSESQGDPRGELDLARPLPSSANASSVVASALWAWSESSGDALAASRAVLAAARALGDREGPAQLLSLVAAQLDGAERDQACAVFRARVQGTIPACP
ncbi:MAG: hypothetical protein JST92_15100 [Deltaproteobacteria bacterium]|nr:hypothetical protein [Deltaproteobacteria bacterium]